MFDICPVCSYKLIETLDEESIKRDASSWFIEGNIVEYVNKRYQPYVIKTCENKFSINHKFEFIENGHYFNFDFDDIRFEMDWGTQNNPTYLFLNNKKYKLKEMYHQKLFRINSKKKLDKLVNQILKEHIFS